MDRIHIRGGRPLDGKIEISGAKNAALPLMAACLLTDDTLTLTNVPDLADIMSMARLLEKLGVSVSRNGDGERHAISLTADRIFDTTAPYDLVRRMRASVLVLGPLLARYGQATVSLPGGCAIGARPVDLHLEGMRRLGADIELGDGYIRATATGGLNGARIVFPMVSVGATEDVLMAASLARGETVIENAAREPEISDLARCLVAMGAQIDGIGSSTLTVQGVDRLGGATHEIIADRIETGTYAMAAAITRGRIELVGARHDDLTAVIETLNRAGVTVIRNGAGLVASAAERPLLGVDTHTEPFPGFPTDLQAQFMALMSTADGAAMVTETIFENRFMHVPELSRMGADIHLHGGTAMVRGVPRLHGAPVMATDLRASASLVLAGLAADGETTISRVYHLDRGFEKVVRKLAGCGADIERVKEAG
ncbi:MAG: UDP-N-acetylglucosamine 1-carboxyvinyltransferase [Alphaproteobacteria bacterium]|nr:UDP-N-acetylglucosamine 1-carboxyvinyltransferase [Alphaproteobacteria bacterium]